MSPQGGAPVSALVAWEGELKYEEAGRVRVTTTFFCFVYGHSLFNDSKNGKYGMLCSDMLPHIISNLADTVNVCRFESNANGRFNKHDMR